MSGTTPKVLLHRHRKGTVYLDIRTKSGQPVAFELRVNGFQFYMTNERVVVFLDSSGSSGISSSKF